MPSPAPATRPPRSFIGQVRQLLDRLPPTERRLGEFVLTFPGDLAGHAASELAAMVGVSNAIVTRFIRRLGCASYEEARRHARAASESGPAPFMNRAPGGSS